MNATRCCTRWLALFALLLPGVLHAAEQQRFVSTVTLATGQTVVVAEGDYEPRSIGSFSLRLYAAATAGDETTFFASGLVSSRDGALERIALADLGDACSPAVVVIARSVGSGSYQSAYAFEVADDTLAFCAAVEGLAADANPVGALQDALAESR